MDWSNPVNYSPAGLATNYLTGKNYGLSDLFRRNTETVTDPYSEWLAGEMQDYTGGLKEQFGTQQYDPNSPMGRAMATALKGNAVNAKDWGMMGEKQLQDYYMSALYNPAVRQYENVTRPAWMEKVGNLHGSYRDTMEQRGYEDLYGGLEQQRGQLGYENVLRNQEMRRQADVMNLQAQQNAMGLYGTYDPQQMYMRLLAGQTPTSTIVQQPSTMDMLSQLAGIGGNAAMMYSAGATTPTTPRA